MEQREIGLLVIGAAAVVALIGVLILTGALSWFGRLPGDIRIERENVRVYAPLASMLLISVGLSLALWLLRRIF